MTAEFGSVDHCSTCPPSVMSNTRSESPSPSTEKSEEGNEQKRVSPETASDTSTSPTPEQGAPNDPPEASSSKHVDEKREGTSTSVENGDPDEGADSKPPRGHTTNRHNYSTLCTDKRTRPRRLASNLVSPTRDVLLLQHPHSRNNLDKPFGSRLFLL